MRSIAVVGASLAGLHAARALRDQGFGGTLTIIGAEPHRPYDRPPLSKEFLAGRIGQDDLALEPEGEDLDAEWLLGVPATGLDTGRDGHRDKHSVLLADGTRVSADGVVIATGAAAATLPGNAASGGTAGVHTLRSVDDALALRAELLPGRRLVVIGAGFIGAEVASTARELGLDVTIVETAPAPFARALGPEMGAVLGSMHEDRGVRVLCGSAVQALIGTGPDGGRVDGVLLGDGRRLPADVVLVGIGARPAVGWLEGSGVALGEGPARDGVPADGVLCDAGGATNVPGVVAVGDCAAWFDPSLGRHHRVEHWTGAVQRPTAAAATLLSGGTAATPPPAPPYLWSDQYGMRIQFAGHTRPGDTVTVEQGDVAERSFLAVYRREDRPVAVLGVDQVRQFTRWRRTLSTVSTG
ncbi:pyridine nucleotide-disulfide oxidoreductase [Planotetraspora thailandica]|uniref:Pyridine nucleotide-disulfide oxidoreductase n=1 Tax=Planotetraspora thailandica TaxID=487172 RepID=A0A8J3VA15_9ACTN|nr:FAD-dependent oxidoreductase [Planotetraspora thailandica]GII56909.1 pyridine nucleotide-disulfide oxidoreductase [Planotetraspora thailandica]